MNDVAYSRLLGKGLILPCSWGTDYSSWHTASERAGKLAALRFCERYPERRYIVIGDAHRIGNGYRLAERFKGHHWSYDYVKAFVWELREAGRMDERTWRDPYSLFG